MKKLKVSRFFSVNENITNTIFKNKSLEELYFNTDIAFICKTKDRAIWSTLKSLIVYNRTTGQDESHLMFKKELHSPFFENTNDIYYK